MKKLLLQIIGVFFILLGLFFAVVARACWPLVVEFAAVCLVFRQGRAYV